MRATAADEWVKLGKREGKNKAVSTCGKMWRCSKAREIFPRWNFSLDPARDVHVRTFFFGFIDIILFCINQSLKTETEGYLNTVR